MRIRKETRRKFDESLVEDSEFVFNWYLKAETFHIWSEDLDFFFDMVDSDL